MTKFNTVVKPDWDIVQRYLEASFENGQLSNFGPCYQRLTTRLKELIGNWGSEVLVTTSGHTALMAAYSAFRIKKPLMPAYTFNSTYSAATIMGIEPMVIDVDYDSGCLTLEQIEQVPLECYDSVVVVCALSNVPDLHAIQGYCWQHDKKLIIDAAAAFGTPSIGKYGDAICFSFHATKTMPVGEMGVVMFNEMPLFGSDSFERAKSFIQFGFDKDKNVRFTGMNAKVSEYTCAIALTLLDKTWSIVDRRLENTERYRQNIGDLIYTSIGENVVYQALPIHVNEEIRPRIEQVLREKSIEYLRYYRPICDLVVSKKLYDTNLCLPVHQDVSIGEIDDICDVVLDCHRM